MTKDGETGERWELGWPQQTFSGATEWLIKNEKGELIAKVYSESDGRVILAGHEAAQRVGKLEAALTALAKAQYDGTIEGLRHQMETEDWGDILNVDEVKAAYELTLDALLAEVKG